MRKTRKTAYEERLEIVQDCLANDKNYGATAKKYECSYQQVRNWVKRYENMGSAGLEDRCMERRPTAGFAELNGRDAERAATSPLT